jgi:beta-lactamase class A
MTTGAGGAIWGIHAVTLGHEARVIRSENAHLVLRSASTAKILLLLAVARGISRGELDPAEPLRRDAVAFVADSGIWHRLRAQTLELDDAARLVGAVSDNLATNVLLHRLGGVAHVAQVAFDYGIDAVALHDIVRDERLPQHPPTLSTGTAAGYAELVRRLATADGIERDVAERVCDWLRDGADTSMVAAAFHLDPLAHRRPDRGVSLFNKTGTDTGIRVDAGVVTDGEAGIAYACLVNWDAATAADPARDAVLEAMRGLGVELREALGELAAS